MRVHVTGAKKRQRRKTNRHTHILLQIRMDTYVSHTYKFLEEGPALDQPACVLVDLGVDVLWCIVRSALCWIRCVNMCAYVLQI